MAIDAFIDQLPNALETNLSHELILDETVALKITLLRGLLLNPEILWIDHILDDIEKSECEKILNLIQDKARLCIITTGSHRVMSVLTQEEG